MTVGIKQVNVKMIIIGPSGGFIDPLRVFITAPGLPKPASPLLEDVRNEWPHDIDRESTDVINYRDEIFDLIGFTVIIRRDLMS